MLGSLLRLDRLQKQLDRVDRMLADASAPATRKWAKTKPAKPKPSTEQLARWRDDPVAFAFEALGVTLWWAQIEICLSIARHDRVTVRSGHKVGKSRLQAVVALWFAVTRPSGRVLLTAPTYRQINRILWREIRKLCRDSKIDLGAVPAKAASTGMEWPDGSEIVGISTNEPERVAGFSGEHLLFLVDEASGVDEEIFEAIEGNCAGGGKQVLTSNPTRTVGTFFDSHQKADLAKDWQRHHISSEETPNVVAGQIEIRGLATREWVDARARQWGKGSALYQIRVAGNFPQQGSNSVIGVALIEAAKQRWGDVEPGTTLDLGVDVARFGDDESVIVPRRGLVAYPVFGVAETERHQPGKHGYACQGFDNVEVAGLVKQTIHEMRAPGERVRIKIDGGGNGGGVIDTLRAWQAEGLLGEFAEFVEIIELNFGSKPSAPGEFILLRDELWWGIRRWLMDGAALPPDDQRDGELAAPTYAVDSQGRIKVDSKDKIKALLPDGRSPDRADALGLAVYESELEIELDDADASEGYGAFESEARGFG